MTSLEREWERRLEADGLSENPQKPADEMTEEELRRASGK